MPNKPDLVGNRELEISQLAKWEFSHLNKAGQKTPEWKCSSQNESEIKVDDAAAASLFHFGMSLLV